MITTAVLLHHPITGHPLTPVGYRKNGLPIMPILGGADEPPTDPPAPADPPTDPPKPTDPPAPEDTDDLGPKGKAALERERTARRDAEKRAKDGEAAIARLQEIEDAEKTELEKEREAREATDKENAELKAAQLRRDVADTKGLTPSQAKRLVGTTKEELEADADQLLEDLKVPPVKKGAPAPPAGGGKSAPASLSDAVSGHYAGRS